MAVLHLCKEFVLAFSAVAHTQNVGLYHKYINYNNHNYYDTDKNTSSSTM